MIKSLLIGLAFGLVTSIYGYSMHQMGFSFGVDHGKHLKVMEFIQIRKQCHIDNPDIYERAKTDLGPRMTFDQFSAYYDGVLGACTSKAFTK